VIRASDPRGRCDGGGSVASTAAMLIAGLSLAFAMAAFPGCTAMQPQYAAQQAAPSYYEGNYNSLTPQQKFQLEDHLANQSNQAWQTTAQVMGGAGRLLGGTGTLLGAIRSMQKPPARHVRAHPTLRLPGLPAG
jgi:hypothetical protein